MPAVAAPMPALGSRRRIVSGDPGEVWTNDGDKVQYQLIVNWKNSCAVCVSRDHLIGPLWPTPFHRNCNCKQKAVYPGRTSEPFVDFREKVSELPPSERSRVMGKANLQLVEAGVVQWDDVVTSGRIRSLREVVSREKLDVATMTKAGVLRRHAEAAYASVHTPAHVIAAEERNQAFAELAKLVGAEKARQRAADRLAARLTPRSDPGARPSKILPAAAALDVAAVDFLLGLGVKPEVVAAHARATAGDSEEGTP